MSVPCDNAAAVELMLWTREPQAQPPQPGLHLQELFSQDCWAGAHLCVCVHVCMCIDVCLNIFTRENGIVCVLANRCARPHAQSQSVCKICSHSEECVHA
jgi:hypothetical protein